MYTGLETGVCCPQYCIGLHRNTLQILRACKDIVKGHLSKTFVELIDKLLNDSQQILGSAVFLRYLFILSEVLYFFVEAEVRSSRRDFVHPSGWLEACWNFCHPLLGDTHT